MAKLTYSGRIALGIVAASMAMSMVAYYGIYKVYDNVFNQPQDVPTCRDERGHKCKGEQNGKD